MSSQYGNHSYDREHDEYLREKLAKVTPELREKAEMYDWSDETLASMV